MDLVHIVRTEYNFDSLIKLPELIKKVKELGMKSIAVADDHSLYAGIDFLELCNKENINGIVGCRFSLVTTNTQVNVTLFARNLPGYKQIMKLSSLSKLRKGHAEYITQKEIEQFAHNVVCLTDVTRPLQDKGMDIRLVTEDILALKQHFKEDFYLELKENQGKVIQQQIASFSTQTKTTMMASNDVSYLEKREERIGTIIKALGKGKKLEEVTSKGGHFKTLEEMKQTFPAYPEAIDATVELAKKCRVNIPMKGAVGFVQKTPKYRIPSSVQLLKNIAPLYKKVEGYVLPTDEKELLAIHYLIELAWKGFAKYYKKTDQVAMERLKYELGIIISKGYADYFLVIWDMLNYAKKNDIQCKVRGSVLSSLLARCLNITDICPIKYGLKFERFLNSQRSDSPDIDIDVSQKKRYELIRYIQRKYGRNNVSQIITFGTYGLRNAVECIGKLLGMEEKIWSKLATTLPIEINELKSKQNILEMARKDPKVKELIEAAYKIAPIARNKSRHPAGILVSEHSLIEELPVWSEKDEESSILVTQIQNNKTQLERLGFLKIDILGLRNIDTVEETHKLVKERHQVSFEEVPLDDPKTFDLYRKGDLIGLFQVESDGMRQSSVMIQPTDINDIIALVALYRPGPKNEIKRYAENKKSGRVIVADDKGNEMVDEGLKEILKETYGVLTYQEQIYAIAQKMGNYSIVEADMLRRAITKKNLLELTKERQNFVEKAVANQYSSEIANNVYDFIVKFADYGLNKAHAAGYAIFSYTTAWYKANYPLEYMTVLINSMITGKKKDVNKAAKYIEEAKRMGIAIKNPDVNESSCDFTIQGEDIYFGLSMVKNVGRVFAKQVVEEREKNGQYRSFDDFLQRIGTNIAIESLIKVGAFDGFGRRKELLARFLGKRNKVETTSYRFSEIPSILPDDPTSEEQDFTIEEKLTLEKELLCTYLSLDKIVVEVEKRKVGEAKTDWVAGVVLSVKKTITKKEKREMAFAQIYTSKGESDFTFFPKEWERYRKHLVLFSPVLMKVNEGERGKNVQELIKVSKVNIVKVQVPEEVEDKKRWLIGLMSIMRNHPGPDSVQVDLGDKKLHKANTFHVNEQSMEDIYAYVKNKRNVHVLKSSV